MGEEDALRLADEPDSENSVQGVGVKPWYLLVVDDEEEVHAVTGLALDGFTFAGRPVEILSAYTGREAIEIMKSRNDIAMILLDVVMETDTAGLDCAQYIREVLQNHFVRIVLRTGQPGQAPEYKVITEYDINDYKEKTELTRQKLFTCVYTSLSSYRDLVALERHRQGLLKVIEASGDLFQYTSLDNFTQGVIEQISALLYLDSDVIVVRTSGLALDKTNGNMSVVAATGRFTSLHDERELHEAQPEVCKRINVALLSSKSCYGKDYYVGYYKTPSGVTHILYVAGDQPVSTPDISLVDLFAKNAAIAHEKLLLINELKARH